MLTIGVLGGMSWESTLHYYRLLNEGVRERAGGLSSAKILLWSVDFAPVAAMQAEGRWEDAGALLGDAGAALERAGADFLVLATNTMHRVAGAIEARTKIPLLHIADPTGEAVRARGLRRVGLLGTRFTMEQAFYKERLSRVHGLEVSVPPEEDRTAVHRIIYEELCKGEVREASRDAYRRIAASLIQGGAEAIIFGCTEIMMLLQPEDASVPVFDTTALHAEAAVERALR